MQPFSFLDMPRPTHDDLVREILSEFMPAALVRITHILAGTCTIRWSIDEEQERLNDPIVETLATIRTDLRRLAIHRRWLGVPPRSYYRGERWEPDELDRFLTNELSNMTARVVCSVCGLHHSGRTCDRRKCSFCLSVDYALMECWSCSHDLHRVLEPPRHREGAN